MMSIDGKEFLLADVVRGMSLIGVCAVNSPASLNSARAQITDLLYIGSEPIVTSIRLSADSFANKHIAQISGTEKCDEPIKERLTGVGDNYFLYKQSMARSVMPVLEMLTPGLYVIHEAKMQQSDGAGNFFWNAYNIRHEINGSSDYNSVIGINGNYSPCFLIPSKQVNSYKESNVKMISENISKGKEIGGLAYHLTGMFSVLLEGHHAATACLCGSTDFKCLVIEPVRDIAYASDEAVTKENERGAKAIGLACPYVNIPFESLPENMLESFLITRKYTKPEAYADIKPKSTKILRPVSKRVFKAEIYELAEQLPDIAMVESASAVTGLSEEQLDTLLSGEIRYEDKYIISNNYYSSIVTACNYLQATDFKRFLRFAFDILENEDLSATHKYVAERLLNIINPQILAYFKEVIEGDGMYQDFVKEIARKYLKRYSDYRERIKEETEQGVSSRIKRLEQASQQSSFGKQSLAKLEEAAKNVKH